MPLEMYVYRTGIEEAEDYEVLLPGKKMHILTVVKQGKKMVDKIYEVYCRSDDRLSTVHGIYPRLISIDLTRASYNRLEDVENRPIILYPGDEVNLPVRQRVNIPGRRKFITGHIALIHR